MVSSRDNGEEVYAGVRAHASAPTIPQKGVVATMVPIVLPLLALVGLASAFVVTLWRRDRLLPVWELGTVLVSITVLYAGVPLVNYLAGGARWTILSDARLWQTDTTPAEVAALAWRAVAYLTSLVSAYLVLRGHAVVPTGPVAWVGTATWHALLVCVAGLTAYFGMLQVVFGVPFAQSYAARDTGPVVPSALPYVLQQLTHNLAGMMAILKHALVLVCLQRWRWRRWRLALGLWLVAEVLYAWWLLGGRSSMAWLLLATVLLFHRLVRPLTLRGAALLGGSLLLGLLSYGVVRDWSGQVAALWEADVPVLALSNEFQALWGTATDLFVRRWAGTLPPVPWALAVSEVTLLVPSQLLPFAKMEPSDWYLTLIGLDGTGVGLMFGVLAQAAIGGDWLELVLRGLLVGAVAAMGHRWYVRRATRCWPTLLYLWLCITAYYSFRAASFYAVTFVVYQFVPAMLLVRVTATLVRAAQGARWA